MNRIGFLGFSMVAMTGALGCAARQIVSQPQLPAEGTAMTKRAGVSLPTAPNGQAAPSRDALKAPHRHPVVSSLEGLRDPMHHHYAFGNPGQPQMLPPDTTVQGAYTSKDGNEIRVEGVCKISEDTVSCWTSTGGPAKSLADQVKTCLTSQSHNGNYVQPLSFQFGRKNRYVVTTSVMKQQMGGGRASYVSVRSVGDGQGNSSIGLSNGFLNQGGQSTSTNMNAYLVATDAFAASTRVRVEETQPINATALLDPRKGASCSIDGHKIQILSIERQANQMFSGQPGKQWIYKMSLSNSAQRPFNLSCQIVDKKGQPFQMLDEHGAPARYNPQPMLSPQSGGKGNMQFRRFSSQRPLMIYAQALPDGKVQLISNVDPSVTPKLLISGSYMRRIDITNVPLDPR